MKKNFPLIVVGLACVAAGLLSNATAQAQGWGSLHGQFVFDGKAPVPGTIEPTKDPQYCGKFKLIDEEILVNAENGGIANIVTWLYVAPAEARKPAIHPDLQKLTTEKVKVDNKECRFAPHVSIVWTQQTVELANSDTVGHNMNITSFKNGSLNQLIPGGKSLEHKFGAEETLPIPVACNIHPWMKGYIVIRDNPYAAVTDSDGKFEIRDLPAGKWKFRFWHEKPGYVQEVVRDGKTEPWRRGEVEVEIKDGEVIDLGVIKVKPAALKL
jgi:plastocyanin